MADKCISCKKDIVNDNGSIKIKCPSCGEHEIIRCKNCRQIVAKYTCPGCGFTGPN